MIYMHAASVCIETLHKNKKVITKMESVQRISALRVKSTSKTVSKCAILVLASVLSIDLLVLEKTKRKYIAN